MHHPATPADMMVMFYRKWHGGLGLKGAGYLLGRMARTVKSLHDYPLRLPEGHTIRLDFRDVSAMTWLNYSLGDSFQEAGLLEAIGLVIGENASVWDVGANCGLVSYLLAKNTTGVNIVSFEPNKQMYDLCRSALEPFPHASCLRFALSDTAGEREMHVPEGASTLGTIEPSQVAGEGHRLRIRCEVGDELVKTREVTPPTVIKIDAEGHEMAVLRGLKNTIMQHQPTIFLEHLSLSDEDLFRNKPDGYRIYSVSSVNGSLVEGIDRSRGHNSALIHGNSVFPRLCA